MSHDESPGLRPILLVLGAMFAFSLMALFTREAQANIVGIAAWRAVFVAIVFGIWAFAREGRTATLRPTPLTLKWGAWLGVALAVASSTFVGGYALTTVANTIFLHNLAPVVVFPLAWWLFKERSHPSALAGAGIALAGVGLLTGVSFFQVAHFANARFLLGDLLALTSAVGYAAVLTITRLTRREELPILGTLFIAWSVTAGLLVTVALISGGLSVSAESLLWILGLAIICTNLPFYLLNLGMQRVTAGMAAVLSLSEVLFATVLGIVVYQEHLAPIGWVGALLAGLGVLYAVTQRGVSADAGAPQSTLHLDDSTRWARVGRVVVALGLLNGGVVLGFMGQGETATLLAIVGLVILSRYGPGLAAAWLEGRFSVLLRWSGALVAAAAVAACFLRAGEVAVVANLLPVLLALTALLADAWLMRTESTDAQDRQPLVTATLLLLIAASVAKHIEHGLADALAELANFSLGWAAVGLVVASFSGALVQAAPGRGGVLPRFEGPARWLGMGRRPLVLGVVLWIAGAVRIVPTGSIGVVERFGAPLSQTDGAGLVVRLPPPIETITVVDVHKVHRVTMVSADRSLLTGDQSMIDVAGVVHYTVSDPEQYAYGTADPAEVLAATARAVLVEVVIRRSQDSVLTTGREEVEKAVLEATQLRADALELGIRIAAVHLNHTAVPAPVLAAFLDVISADEERLTHINKAEAYAAEAIPLARGKALAAVSIAQGESARMESAAASHVTWFNAVSDGGKRSPVLTRARLTWESLEKHLTPTKLILAPANVRVWWSGGDGRMPVDVPEQTNTGSEP